MLKLMPLALKNIRINSVQLFSCKGCCFVNPVLKKINFIHCSAHVGSYKNYYDVLGISRDASQGEIKDAYFKLAKKHHPDVTTGSSSGSEKFQGISEAYRVLGNRTSRQEYDSYGNGPNYGQHTSNNGAGWEGSYTRMKMHSKISEEEARRLFEKILEEFRNMESFTQKREIKTNIIKKIGNHVLGKAIGVIARKILEEMKKQQKQSGNSSNRNPFEDFEKWRRK